MHRVYMRFERVFDEWRITFINLSGKDALRELRFADSDKIEVMVERAGALQDLAAKQALAIALRNGLGGVELKLTGEQYGKLKR